MLPQALGVTLLESLYERAAAEARDDIPGAHFSEIQIEVHPFGSTTRPGVTLEVWFGFREQDKVYSYEWTDDTDWMFFRGQTHSLVTALASRPPNPCDPLPWRREGTDLGELVRHGYRSVVEAFPAHPDAYYTVGASSLDTDCRWLATFWRREDRKARQLGTFFQAGPGFIVQEPTR